MEHCRAGRSHLLPVVQRLVLLRREDGTRFPQQTATAALLLHPNGHIYTQMIDEDFYEFDGKDFLHLFPRSQVNDDNVVALLPDGDDSFLMVTENNGLFRYNGDITPWKQTLMQS